MEAALRWNAIRIETNKHGTDMWKLDASSISFKTPAQGTLIEVPDPHGTYQTLIVRPKKQNKSTCTGCYFSCQHTYSEDRNYIIQCSNIPCSWVIYEPIENAVEDMV